MARPDTESWRDQTPNHGETRHRIMARPDTESWRYQTPNHGDIRHRIMARPDTEIHQKLRTCRQRRLITNKKIFYKFGDAVDCRWINDSKTVNPLGLGDVKNCEGIKFDQKIITLRSNIQLQLEARIP